MGDIDAGKHSPERARASMEAGSS